jgi:hypothetical protein
MSTRKLFIILALLLLPTASQAHTHKAEAAVGGSVAKGSALVGGYGSAGVGILHPNLMLIADVSDHSLSIEDKDPGVTRRVKTLGGRFWFPRTYKWKLARVWNTVHPFTQVTRTSLETRTKGLSKISDITLGVAVGADIFSDDDKGPLGWRVQVEGLWPSSGFEARFSTGLVFRFWE